MSDGRLGGRGTHWDEAHERAREFLIERARDRALVLFIGSGVSRAAGLPNWRDLLAPLAKAVGANGETDDPLDIAQWYLVQKGRSALLDHVRSEIGKAQTPGKLHQSLAEIPAPVLFTTNYDQIMERAIAADQGVPPDAIVLDEHVGLADESRRTTVVKLHGCLSLPESIALARDDYETYADDHPAMIAYLQSLLATRTVLFVGTSMTDPNFRTIHSEIRRALGKYQRRAYLLEIGQKNEAHVKDWALRGVIMFQFPSADAELTFVQSLARGPRARARSTPRPGFWVGRRHRPSSRRTGWPSAPIP